MKRTSIIVLIVCGCTWLAHLCHADYQITTMGVPITETFDAFNATNLSHWLLICYGTNTLGNGSLSTGGLWAYTNAPHERSLGYQGSTPLGTVCSNIAFFTNVSGHTIGTLSITNYYEQWRFLNEGNRTNAWRAWYSISGAAWSAIPEMSWWSSLSNGTYFGIGSQNRSLATASLTGLSIPDGAGFRLMWTSDRGGPGGSSPGIAIDDLTVVPVVPEPAFMLTLALLAWHLRPARGTAGTAV